MAISRYRLRILLLLLSVNSILRVSAAGNGTDVYFSFMVAQPLNGTAIEQDTSGVIPAVRLALEAINKDSSVLSGYNLNHGDVLNSQCERTTSLDTFFADITDIPPNKVFLLGCGCSIATAPVGEISHFWEIIQMSYASLTPTISDRSSYPNLFTIIPSALTYRNVIQSLMNTYGWTRLVVVSQMENEFIQLSGRLQSMDTGGGEENVVVINFKTQENVAENPQLFNLDADYRIYFLNMYQRHARRVLCAAYQRSNDIHYPRYVFIVPGTYSDQWWTMEDNTNCTVDQLETVLDYSLVIATYPTAEDEGAPTDVQMTYKEFQQMYDEQLAADSLNATFAAPFAYDGLWALVLAINNTNLSIPLSEFNNKRNGEIITAEVIQQFKSTSFTGLTGPVSFGINGTRKQTQPRVMQYRLQSNSSYNPVLVGRINNNSGVLSYVNNETNDTVWPIVVPFDGSDLTELQTIVLPIFVILYTIATIAIIFTIGCAIVNFCLRNRKVIRLTSPNLNYLIILGCGLMIVSVYFYTYPTLSSDVLYGMCIVRAYTQNVGYVLCFGTVCAKMGRVYFIFHNPSPSRKRRTIKDWHLFLIVWSMVAVIASVVTVSLAIDRDYKPVRVKYREDPTGTNEYGVRINYETLVCTSDRSIFWIGIIFVLLFLNQAAAVFFAVKTRKVKIKALNDAKNISVIIYVTSVLLTILLIGALILDDFLNADAGLFGSGIIVVPIVVLLLLFIPKWYNLYKDPEGKNIFEGSGQPTFSSMMGGISDQDYNKAVNRIEELENRLGKYEAVTPFQARKRVLSSAVDSTHTATGLLRPGIRGGRGHSFSPGPLDVTASLPTRMHLSPTPVPPLSPLGNGAGPTDSGAGTMTSTQSGSDESPDARKSTVALTIEEVDEPPYSFLESQEPLTATSNL